MRGSRTPLVESILVGSFRPDRMGARLLDEPLPEACPVVDVSPEAEAAWRDLRTAQEAFMDSGVVSPWQFARLVRAFHRALAGEDETASVEESMTEGERQTVMFNLSIGPVWEVGQTHVRDDHPYPQVRGLARETLSSWGYDEDELREFWDEWASTAKVWDETTWAYHRFVRGLSPARAEVAASKAWNAEHYPQRVEP